MNRSSRVLFLSLSLIFVLFSCKRISEPTPPAGLLEKTVLSDVSGIPAQYGELVGVTAHAQYEGWSQLWFVDSTSTIRMVRIQFHTDRIHERVLVIPRN